MLESLHISPAQVGFLFVVNFVEMNLIIINSMKYGMCDININDIYSKYFVYNDSSFILFQCDFTYNLLLQYNVSGRLFSVLSEVTINVSCLKA